MSVRYHAFRLNPGADLREEIDRFATTQQVRAGFLATCAGSLNRIRIRLANRSEASEWSIPAEILSLTGTVSLSGSHLHLAFADGEGLARGGHLLTGCRIYTTAEIVLGELEDLAFERAHDPLTGFRELQIKPR